MTRLLAKADTIDPQGGYVVRRPHASDALGLTLRSAFGGEARQPDELATLLRALDRVPARD